MNADHSPIRSVWTDVEPASRPKLSAPVDAEVVVIGAGLSGLSVAYELQKGGRSVVVLDASRIGGGETERSSGHLSFGLDDFYDRLIKHRNLEAGRAYYESQSAAVDRVEAIVREEGIDCDFARLDGYLISTSVDDDDLLDQERLGARKAGVPGVGFVDQAPLQGVDTGAALRFPKQARFHPLKYVLGLAAAFERAGGRIFGDTLVTVLSDAADQVVVRTREGVELHPAQAVAAAHNAFGAGVPFHSKQTPVRTYLLAAQTPKGSAADILLRDTADPYTYVRIQPAGEHDLLIVGGQDHKVGAADDAAERFERLEGWARKHFHQMSEVTHRWSGQLFEPDDFVPFIGRVPGQERLFTVTGGSGEGATAAAMAGLVLRDLVNGRETPWAAVYDPSRTMPVVSAVAEFVKDQAGMVANLVERMTPGEVKSVDDLSPDSGAVVGQAGGKVAAYRDVEGGLHRHSAECTHAPCLLRFNSFERCWDCPCHGCRYGVDGAVLAGPATESLAPVA